MLAEKKPRAHWAESEWNFDVFWRIIKTWNDQCAQLVSNHCVGRPEGPSIPVHSQRNAGVTSDSVQGEMESKRRSGEAARYVSRVSNSFTTKSKNTFRMLLYVCKRNCFCFRKILRLYLTPFYLPVMPESEESELAGTMNQSWSTNFQLLRYFCDPFEMNCTSFLAIQRPHWHYLIQWNQRTKR